MQCRILKILKESLQLGRKLSRVKEFISGWLREKTNTCNISNEDSVIPSIKLDTEGNGYFSGTSPEARMGHYINLSLTITTIYFLILPHVFSRKGRMGLPGYRYREI